MLLFWNKPEIEFHVSYLLDVASLAAWGRESRGCCFSGAVWCERSTVVLWGWISEALQRT